MGAAEKKNCAMEKRFAFFSMTSSLEKRRKFSWEKTAVS